jgi:PAS domain S-box-containing protein
MISCDQLVLPPADVEWDLCMNSDPIELLPADSASRDRREEERERFFDLTLDLIAWAGMDGYFKRLNPAWERTLGYPMAELLAHPWLDFVHPDDRAATIAEGEKLAHGAIALDFENRYRCRDGSYRWLAWRCVPVVSEGMIYAVARDCTDQKVAEQELREKNLLLEASVRAEREARIAMNQAQSRLIQAEKLVALGQLVAGVAHEINNPLAFVINNLAVLNRDVKLLLQLQRFYQSGEPLLAAHDPALLGQIQAFCDRIDLPTTVAELTEVLLTTRDGLTRIQQIVMDLRDFARQEALGGVQEHTDLNRGIESTVNIVLGQARRRQIELIKDLQALNLITCQPAKINQVVLNLVMNAIDACGDGGRVTVRSRNSPTGVYIEIEDSGTGIEPEIRNKIFDPFFTTKPQGKGTGLGLSISHGIVADHGGRIEVDSEPGKGSTFRVHLPLGRGNTAGKPTSQVPV